MTTADRLTVLRAALALPVAAFVLVGRPDLAFVVFVPAAFTDAIDGALARRLGPTALGARLDPLADKALVLATLAALVVQGGAGLLPVALIAFRELGVTWLRRSADGPAVDAVGKVKTVLQCVAVGALLARLGPAADVLLWGATALTLLSGAAYATRPLRTA